MKVLLMAFFLKPCTAFMSCKESLAAKNDVCNVCLIVQWNLSDFLLSETHIIIYTHSLSARFIAMVTPLFLRIVL
jgi:hypothetical protein